MEEDCACAPAKQTEGVYTGICANSKQARLHGKRHGHKTADSGVAAGGNIDAAVSTGGGRRNRHVRQRKHLSIIITRVS